MTTQDPNVRISTEKSEDGRFLVSVEFLDDDSRFSFPVTAPTKTDAIEAVMDFVKKFRNQ